MVKKAKKVTKSQKKIDSVANPIEELIKNADEGIIITVKEGIVTVNAIKNINFSYQVKGLLIGALDSYTTRPTINAINSLATHVVTHFNNAVEVIKKENK